MVVLVIVIIVLIFIIRRNHKEKIRLTKMLNKDYHKDEDLEVDANDDNTSR
ncbi:MAG TPA: hypothetical protein VFQ50_07650 [Flavobacterium sp.]|nr:hypothetical protein [Flavobacterium sp.]